MAVPFLLTWRANAGTYSPSLARYIPRPTVQQRFCATKFWRGRSSWPCPRPTRVRWTDLAALAGHLDLVRFSARSFFGRRVEQQLRRIRVEPTRRLEVDTAHAAMAMVGAGISWAITTPLCLLQRIAYAERIRCLPLPGPGFGRRLTLIARQQEFGDLPGRIAEAAAGVLRERCLPAISAQAAFAVGHARRKGTKALWAGGAATWAVAICAVPAMLSEGTTTKGTPAADLGAARYP